MRTAINAAAIKREFQKMQKVAEAANAVEMYRGFPITGAKHHYVADWPKVYKSRKAAREAVDTCISIRERAAELLA